METILIVDDHASFRSQARALLEADGYVVVGEASDGREALVASRTLKPDIVLLDIGLPDLDGFSVAEVLSGDPEVDKPVAVVLTSSREAAVYGTKIAASSAAGFVPKDELSGAAIRDLVDADWSAHG